MAFCSGCGGSLEDGAKFCPYCGAKTASPEPKPESRSEKSFARENEFAGSLVKCPACGTELPSLTAICPACGHEVNSARVSDSLQSFISQIDECDKRIASSGDAPKKGWSTWGKWKKFGWVILNIYFACIPLLIYFVHPYLRSNKAPSLTSDEKRKATIIENYTFPNDRGSILEAMLFIKSKVGFLVEEKVNANNSYWMRLWSKKAEQLHQKAEMLFPGDKIANDTYNQILANSKLVKKKMQIRIGATFAIVVIAIIFLATRGGVGTGSPTNVDKNATYEWPNNQFTAILPEPEVKTGKISSEYEKQFQFVLYNVSPDEFEDYVEACREAGFTVGITKNDDVFYASDENGYDLNIFYYDNKEEMHISIDAYDLAKTDSEVNNTDEEKEFAASEDEPDDNKEQTNTSSSDTSVKPDEVVVVDSAEITMHSNEYLEISEFGYHMSGEYLHGIVALKNPSDKIAIEFPTYRVTAYDSNGKILGSEEHVLSVVYPKQEFVCASILIDVGEKPAKIDVTVLEPDDYNITNASALEYPTHEQMVGKNISINDDSVTGEIYNPNGYKVDFAVVTVIFRDEAGTIVYSEETFVDQIPANGSVPFDIYLFGEDGLPENCEVWAYLW